MNNKNQLVKNALSTKTFEVWENIDYNGDHSEKNHLGYIKAKNLQNAVKRALNMYLTKEQRKNKTVVMSDSDINSYDFETEFYDKEDGNEILDENIEFNEDTMNFVGHELVIEETQNNNEESD